jgi:hypothetical protein
MASSSADLTADETPAETEMFTSKKKQLDNRPELSYFNFEIQSTLRKRASS